MFVYKTAKRTKNLRANEKFTRQSDGRCQYGCQRASNNGPCPLQPPARGRMLCGPRMGTAEDPLAGETRGQRERRVRDEMYRAWLANDRIYDKARREHEAARAIGDERRAIAARLQIEDLENSARRFSTLVAREQVWGWRAPFVALFSWVRRRD